jgi:tRNA-2-methylthio-N6-dimethylallyladenosine synthase
MAKTYNIITYGCAMNRSDSERIAAVLDQAGYRKARKSQRPDILVFNACSVRQTAIDRIYGRANNLRKLPPSSRFAGLRRARKTIVTGCILPRDREKFAEIFDLVLNIKDLKSLPKLLTGLKAKPVADISYFKIKPFQQNSFSARVPISFGCSRFCSYCAVPYTRGLEINRSAKEIISEVKGLIKRGFKEIWLLGQTVSSWKDPQNKKYKFVDLLAEIEKIPGKFWVRFESSYVLDFDDKLINFLAKAKKVNNYLNLPLQSGSDKILKKMNRKYTVKQYLAVLNKMKAKIPDFNFSTDIIVGFCKEAEADFKKTYGVFAKIRPAMAYIAQYSPRSGTAAQKHMRDNVSLNTKKIRHKKLNQLLRQIAKENMAKEIGRTLDVLVDAWSPQKRECLGKTRNFKTVRFESKKNLTGQFVKVKIFKAREFELEGELIR